MNLERFRLFIFYGVILSWGFASAQDLKIDFSKSIFSNGGVERMDTSQSIIFLTFTGGDFGDGTMYVRKILQRSGTPANFFFTGDFYREQSNRKAIRLLVKDGHYLGAHSNKHLLYNSWENRDSLLVTRDSFISDLLANYQIMETFGIKKEDASFFLPPYEWYNDSISLWTNQMGLQLINFTPGTRSNADYTTPDMGERYLDNEGIMQRIFKYEQETRQGLNGFILLLHVGTDRARTDKFYHHLPELIERLRGLGYQFVSLKSVSH